MDTRLFGLVLFQSVLDISNVLGATPEENRLSLF